ncbi:cyanophycinase [Fimbriimonas ginsengisoli]|uniref:Cyanophycinase n=1 Tax=Fimbriimonas ginsengisoli Gsoil 348 TaxID=661478 RepID=A0A068NQ11_FIMGI|nr:cyanophycinase [Fimbriimonas ginsengisoli]AIE85506.1 cyanophycinase [Fimbriimonas ginsengisoli Gsoil 348]
MSRLLLSIFALLALAAAASAQTLGPAKGNLVIVGGGAMGLEIWARFIELAGGVDKAEVVVIPTAGMSVPDDGKTPETRTPDVLKRLGVTHVTVLHTTDRKVADSEEFVAPLKTATAVWFDGGRQWHLADSYLGTRTQKEFDALLERGGVVGGSSAGATIQGEYLWRGDTSGPEKGEGDHTVGFAFLKGSAIDQHILARNRQFDLIPFIEKHPNYLGIGINEGTAIVVHGDQFEVIGASYVAITDARQWQPDAKSPNDAAHKGKIYFLGKGQKFDLASRRIVAPRRQG